MQTTILVGLFTVFLTAHCQDQIQIPSGSTLLYNKYAFMADKGLVSYIKTTCDNQRNKKVTQSNSIESLIALVEKLEDELKNSLDANLNKIKSASDVARLLLHR